MEGGKKSTRPCAKCGKQFIPTTERKLTCEACYRLNSQIPPMAEEPDSVKRKKAPMQDDSVFKRIHISPTKISR